MASPGLGWGTIGVRWRAVLAAGLAVVAAAGCGTPASEPLALGGACGTTASPRTAAAGGHVAAGALKGHGELAFVGYGRLFLLGGPAGGGGRAPQRVDLPGIAFAPAWSADHRWLAVEVSAPPLASNPYQQGPAALWLVNAAGTRARRLTPAAWDVTSFAWSPRAPRLAAAVYRPGATRSRSYAVVTVAPAGQRRVLATGYYVSGAAWSPDGQRIAAGVATYSFPSRAGSWHGRLVLLNPAGGAACVVLASTGNVLELGGWWPDGSGLLYWVETQGSPSLAADGMPLDSVAFAAGRPRQLAWTLAHGSWLAFSPDGHQAAVVAGGYRQIWSGGKHITICRSSGGCTPVRQPAGVVALQPSWSPRAGTVVFSQASASGPFGPRGRAYFSPYSTRRWQATSSLRLAAASGCRLGRLGAAGPGAVDPVWGQDGSILFVRADWLWLLPPGASAPTRLAGPLGALAAPAFSQSYYGYIPYPQLAAWTGARPFSVASSS